MGDRWQREPTLHGCAAGGGSMGAAVGAGLAGWVGGTDAQRCGVHALRRTRHLGLCGEIRALLGVVSCVRNTFTKRGLRQVVWNGASISGSRRAIGLSGMSS